MKPSLLMNYLAAEKEGTAKSALLVVLLIFLLCWTVFKMLEKSADSNVSICHLGCFRPTGPSSFLH